MGEQELTIEEMLDSAEAQLCESPSFTTDPNLYSAVQTLFAVIRKATEKPTVLIPPFENR